jgi:hypothetical protein
MRKAVMVWLLLAFAVVLAFGRGWFGARYGVVVMIGTFVVGFACLRLVVAPWALAQRPRPRR